MSNFIMVLACTKETSIFNCKYPNTFKSFFNTCKVVLAAANEALVVGRARALIVARQRRARVLRAFRHALASHYQRLKFRLKTQ
jgi:hypothetical protein